MSVIYSTEPQGTDAWLQERCGLITASEFKKAVGKGQQRIGKMDTLAFQRRTGKVSTGGYKSAEMERGNRLEPDARNMAMFMLDTEIVEVGLATNTAMPGIGASLDGLIGDSVGWETKCPSDGTHNRYWRENRLPPDYRLQVHGQMLVCELESVWFMSYHPDDSEQLLINIHRDEKVISKLKDDLDMFLDELDSMMEKVNV
jgi:putative phage-type endonuclease